MSGDDAYHLVRTTRPQRLFMSCTDPVAIWRDANQVGKSVSLALMVHDACRGVARFAPLVSNPPVNVIVAGTSWEQMVPLMKKLWDYAPKSELDERNSFDPGRGITGKPPRLVYVRGPGAGSVVSFATYKQGPQRLAGATVPLLVMDEPPPETFYGEAYPRVMRMGGRIRIGFTPTLTSPPLDYLWEKVETGEITEFNFGMSEDACSLEYPASYPHFLRKPWLTQAQIDEFEKGFLPAEREMRMGRSRYPLVGDRAFVCFNREEMVRNEFPMGQTQIGIGIDHGSVAGAQVAVLVAVRMEGDHPRIWVLDEEIADGTTNPDQDAEAITQMLKRNGNLTVYDVDVWVGDRKHGGRAWGGQKDNKLLTDAFCRLLGLPSGRLPFTIETAWKPRGSIYEGVRILHAAMQRGQFVARPQAEHTIEAITQWAWKDDEYKHKIDALRYGAVTLIKRAGFGPAKVRMF